MSHSNIEMEYVDSYNEPNGRDFLIFNHHKEAKILILLESNIDRTKTILFARRDQSHDVL